MTAQASLSLRGRNPDVLTCIANLSNDEVFAIDRRGWIRYGESSLSARFGTRTTQTKIFSAIVSAMVKNRTQLTE